MTVKGFKPVGSTPKAIQKAVLDTPRIANWPAWQQAIAGECALLTLAFIATEGEAYGVLGSQHRFSWGKRNRYFKTFKRDCCLFNKQEIRRDRIKRYGFLSGFLIAIAIGIVVRVVSALIIDWIFSKRADEADEMIQGWPNNLTIWKQEIASQYP